MSEAYNPYHAVPLAQAVAPGNPQSAQEAQARALLQHKGANLMDVYSNPRSVAFYTRIGDMQADCVICMGVTFVCIFIVSILALVARVASTAD